MATAITSTIYADGVQFTDSDNIQVVSSTGEDNSAQRFTATFDNENGRNKSNFTVGDEIIVFGSDLVNVHTYSFPYTFNITLINKLFTGILEDISFSSVSEKESITISGRDYTARLQDATIEPVVYNNQEISVIVKDIIANSTTDVIAGKFVQVTSVTPSRQIFNHIPVFDALKKLADLAGFFFYVDSDKQLHFETRSSVSSGITLDNTNIIKSSFKTTDKEIVNKIWVYGGRVLSGAQDVFATAGTGSVFTLSYKPHNTNVFVGAGSVPYVGGVFEIAGATLGSPLQYLVNFNDKQIVFVSGTIPGNHIPPLGSVRIDYQRSVPIVKFGQDSSSITTYGPHSKVVVDRNITDPSIAEDLVSDELTRNSTPFRQGNLGLRGVFNLIAGNTVTVDLPLININAIAYELLEIKYNFNMQNNIRNTVVDVKVSKKIKDVTDTIKQMILDIKKLQAAEIDPSDLITRLENATGSFGIRISQWYLSTRNVGAAFILGHAANGKLGSPAASVSGPTNVLGDSRVPGSIIQYSGGTWT